ncbi:inositol monophosphatase family protein [Candidatus Latescibacterota bacterium]
MDDSLFVQRRNNFSNLDIVDDFTSLILATVAEVLDILRDLQGEEEGSRVTQTREGEWKSWDAEVYGVDDAAEGAYIRLLGDSPYPVVLLSEEAGRVDLTGGNADAPYYGISDPFDGSWLYKHGLPFMQYSSLALYDSNFNPVTAVTGDVFNRQLAFANEHGAFISDLRFNMIDSIHRLDEMYRIQHRGEAVTDIGDACVETYVLKPGKFLMPLMDRYRDVVGAFKMLHPNGGPFAFAEAAAGQIDVYFAFEQPYVDIYSGLMIAEKAGLIVTDFSGAPLPKPTVDHETIYNILVSRNRSLHDQTLKLIAQCERG